MAPVVSAPSATDIAAIRLIHVVGAGVAQPEDDGYFISENTDQEITAFGIRMEDGDTIDPYVAGEEPLTRLINKYIPLMKSRWPELANIGELPKADVALQGQRQVAAERAEAGGGA